MTHRERILAAMRGQKTDRLPWAPRMDLWCIALRARNALPARFAGMDTAGIARTLDVGCHAVRADYTLARDPADLALRGLGVDNHPDYPYRVELRNLPMDFRHDAENLWTEIRTPAGPVHMHLQQSAEMTRAGISLPFVHDYAIHSAADFEAVAQVFEHLEVIPTPQNYAAFQRRVGNQGVAVANGSIGASPMHLILHDLVAMDQFFYLYVDERAALEELGERMKPFFLAQLEAQAICSAEVAFWGGNYDQNLTWPPFFAEQIAPWLQRVGQRLHASGKLLLTHTDGENGDLMPLYGACGFDVAESVCPHPMTKSSLAEIREGMGAGIAVWGGLPSVAFLDDSMDMESFEAYGATLFGELGGGRRLVLGVADNLPPDADMTRLARVQEWVEEFGPVG